MQHLSPVCGAQEYDSAYLYIKAHRRTTEPPVAPSTEVVNAAIELFAMTLPLQSPHVQESCLEQLLTFLSSTALHKDPSRLAAIRVNTALALLLAVKHASEQTNVTRSDLKSGPVESALQDILHVGDRCCSIAQRFNFQQSLLWNRTKLFATWPEKQWATCAAIQGQFSLRDK